MIEEYAKSGAQAPNPKGPQWEEAKADSRATLQDGRLITVKAVGYADNKVWSVTVGTDYVGSYSDREFAKRVASHYSYYTPGDDIE